MRLLKSNLIIILVIFMLLNVGCRQKKVQYDEKYIINMEDIYNQNDDEYYVYFFKDQCPYCDDTYDTIIKYLEKCDGKEYLNLYICDLSEVVFKTYKIEYLDTYATITFKNDEIDSYSKDIKEIKKVLGKYYITFNHGTEASFMIEDEKIEILDKFITNIVLIGETKKDNIIKRAYDGEGGQGSKGTYYVDGVSRYDELYISGVPSLIKITKDDISYFVTSGRKSVIVYFESKLNHTEFEE